MMKSIASTWILLLWFPAMVSAEVVRVEVDARASVLNGKPFGPYGAYEVITGRMLFAFDPANPMNSRITDLVRAPRNADGSVEAWSNFVVLRPVNGGNGTALVEVSNRGGKFSPRYFNRATSASLAPDDEAAFGDALLLRMGLTVVWIGWQFDVPEREGVLRLHVPTATAIDGSPLTGLARSDWTLDETTTILEVSHRNHLPYAVTDPADSANVLTVRDGRDAPRRIIPREDWQFAVKVGEQVVEDDTHIYMASGFKAGRIYELVYRTQNPAVVGLGLAAIRDVISYAKYNENALFPAQYGLAAGVSQTGRFLRHFLYQGFNTDEYGRMAYDGLMIMTAGAGRGSFNHRFAQPSRDAHRYSAFFYPTDIFPFTSRIQSDASTGQSDGILAHMHHPEHVPKIFQINTGYEYWGRAAALIHTSTDGMRDVEPHPNERLYHIASGQHFVGGFPPAQRAEAIRGNPLDFSVIYRALLVRLTEWVARDVAPPSSAVPRIDNETLVPLDEVAFDAGRGIAFPTVNHVAYRADYGPRWAEGLVDVQPPVLGTPFPSLVAQVDTFNNEVGGIRSVELRVPLATFTPWNLRHDAPGGRHELSDFRGTFIPLAKTESERALRQDPRPSLESLYQSKAGYLERVRLAALEMMEEGFLLEDDLDHVITRSQTYWNWIVAD